MCISEKIRKELLAGCFTLLTLNACTHGSGNVSSLREIELSRNEIGLSRSDSIYGEPGTVTGIIRVDSFLKDKLRVRYQAPGLYHSGTASDNYWRANKVILITE